MLSQEEREVYRRRIRELEEALICEEELLSQLEQNAMD